jgi:peptidoglycan/LPS O-acetylase OafA/YrhL
MYAPQFVGFLRDEAGSELLGTVLFQVDQNPLEHGQLLGAQGKVGAELIDPAEGMGIGNIDRDKGNLAGAGPPCQLHELGKLPVIRPLHRHPHTDRHAGTRGRANPATHPLECIQSPDGGVGLGVGPIQRDRDRLEELCSASGMLGQGQAGSQQPKPQAVGLEQFGNLRPLRVQEGFPARYEHHLGLQPGEAGQQPRHRFEVHVHPAVAPVVAGHATGIAALGHIQSDQRKPEKRRASRGIVSGQMATLYWRLHKQTGAVMKRARQDSSIVSTERARKGLLRGGDCDRGRLRRNSPLRDRMIIFSRIKLGSEKYPALTGIRAVGATAVFFDHFPLWPDAHITLNVLAFFFALSGFLIVRIYYEQVALSGAWLSKYFLNRFARIYPVYFLLLSIAVCLHPDLRPWVLAKNFTLTHALFRGTELVIPPSWSLTVEECFYFLAPLFMVMARRCRFGAPFLLGWLLLSAAVLISKLDIVFLETPAFVLETTFFGHFVEFFAGFYLALCVMELEKKGPVGTNGSRSTLAGLAGVSFLAIAMLLAYRQASLRNDARIDHAVIILINNFLIPIPIALFYWGLIRENTILSRLLSGGVSRLLGRSSYSFYLLHTLIIDYVSIPWLLPATGHRPLCVLLTLIFTWAMSIALFVFYEEPMNVYIRRKFASLGRTAVPPPRPSAEAGVDSRSVTH